MIIMNLYSADGVNGRYTKSNFVSNGGFKRLVNFIKFKLILWQLIYNK